ncbi:MAG: hypothetical protein ACLQOO_13830, partial [Terriglobia bacterium]
TRVRPSLESARAGSVVLTRKAGTMESFEHNFTTSLGRPLGRFQKWNVHGMAPFCGGTGLRAAILLSQFRDRTPLASADWEQGRS